MKHLRHMTLAGNPFVEESESWMDVFSDAVWKNKSLECTSWCHVRQERQGVSAIAAIANVPLSLNRGGRRALDLESSKPLPNGLWSHVLGRATRLSYYDADDPWRRGPSLHSTRADVVFWLLKEKMAGNGLLES